MRLKVRNIILLIVNLQRARFWGTNKVILIQSTATLSILRKIRKIVGRIDLQETQSPLQQPVSLEILLQIRVTRKLHHRLKLRVTLSFREDIGVRHRNDVHWTLEVLTRDNQFTQFLNRLLIRHILCIQTMQNLQLLLQGRMAAGMNGAEVDRTVLNQRQCCTYGHIIGRSRDSLRRSGDDPLSLVREPLKQVE